MELLSGSSRIWWESRRLRYNCGLVAAGVLAFAAYCVVCLMWLRDPGITLFTTLIQGFAYLVMMGVANICYFIGRLLERFVKPGAVARYRRAAWLLGFWFSVLLPFAVPAALAILVITGIRN